MRKDLRFGFTIGGCLLAVLVIWVALSDHGTRKVSEVALAPATQPSDSTPLSTTSTPQSGDAMSAAASPPISTTLPSVADNSSHDWTHLLDTGSAPALAALSGGPTTLPDVIEAKTGAPATQPALASAARTHKVAAGETFYTIAASAYGDGKYFYRIEEANPNVNPNRLRVGTVINLPDASSTPAAVTAGAQSAPNPDTLDASKSYRIQPSDTLMSIARKLYGNGQDWQKIYDANKDAIGPNPARLKVGTVLRLPSQPLASAN